MGELLPLLAVTSANYAEVFFYWRASLLLLGYPSEKLHVVNLGHLQPPFGYCTASWQLAIESQLREVVSWIRLHPGELVIHTDTDIQFFPQFVPLQAQWVQWMHMHRLDMVFMRERTNVVPELREGEVNGGFYILHCNPRTLRFWEAVLEGELRHPKMEGYPPYTDQYHINRLLRYRRGGFPQEGAFSTRWATIPDGHCIWSLPDNTHELAGAAFHHAVNTQDKPALLRRVRGLVWARQQLLLSRPRSALQSSRLVQPHGALHYGQQTGALVALEDPRVVHTLRRRLARAQTLMVKLRPQAHTPANEQLLHCCTCGAVVEQGLSICPLLGSPGSATSSWMELLWSSEDGRGYCVPCWDQRYKESPRCTSEVDAPIWAALKEMPKAVERTGLCQRIEHASPD